MRVTRVRRSVIVAAVLAATAAGCTVGDGHPPDGHSASPTGEGARGPVLAVKIDNVGPARPQTGIGRADIIYAEQVESGLKPADGRVRDPAAARGRPRAQRS